MKEMQCIFVCYLLEFGNTFITVTILSLSLPCLFSSSSPAKREKGDWEVGEGREWAPISSLIHLQDLEDREMGDRRWEVKGQDHVRVMMALSFISHHMTTLRLFLLLSPLAPALTDRIMMPSTPFLRSDRMARFSLSHVGSQAGEGMRQAEAPVLKEIKDVDEEVTKREAL